MFMVHINRDEKYQVTDLYNGKIIAVYNTPADLAQAMADNHYRLTAGNIKTVQTGGYFNRDGIFYP